MTETYQIVGSSSADTAYRRAMLELSPIVENAVALVSGRGQVTATAGLHCSSRSSSSSSSSPCRATSLESNLKD